MNRKPYRLQVSDEEDLVHKNNYLKANKINEGTSYNHEIEESGRGNISSCMMLSIGLLLFGVGFYQMSLFHNNKRQDEI